MTSTFRPFNWTQVALTAGASAFCTALSTRGLTNWRPSDLRALVVTLREGTPAYGVIAMVSALLHARITEPRRMQFPGNTPRARHAALTTLSAWCTGAMTAGVLVALTPVLVHTLHSPHYWSDWAALIAWFASLWFLTALAHSSASLVRSPYSYLIGPFLTVLIAGAPLLINDLVLSNTGRSSLLLSLTWGMTSPSGPWSFTLLGSGLRAILFITSSICLLAATGHGQEAALPPIRRAKDAALWLVPPIALGIAVIAISPELMAPTRTETRCLERERVSACVYTLDEKTLPTIVEGGHRITRLLPSGEFPAVTIKPGFAPSGSNEVLLSTTLPDSPDQLLGESAGAVAGHMAGLPACMARNSREPNMNEKSYDQLEAASQLQLVLLTRARLSSAATSPLTTLTDEAFHRWWRSHQARIVACELTTQQIKSAS